ncbi:MAG: sugar ABC transporter substrate-binding protein [Clostridia bacterium]|nr:sugar ABC transporter substrate-binding protein [Clostridia bacterium]
MKKWVCLAMLVVMAIAFQTAVAEPAAKTIGFYADAADSYYQQVNDVLSRASAADPETDWTVDFKVGQSTAEEQLKAVEDFITAGYDAIIVIQNNPNTTSECIEKCVAAGIPYFGAAHYFGDVPNAKDSAGSVNYDFELGGYLAGQDALARGVKKVINIEGVLGQGSAAAQTLGFIRAYEDAGLSLGGMTAKEIAETKPSLSALDGTQELEIVFWASGGWMADPAQKAMSDAITSLGMDGFDAVYAHNNPMTEGVIAAMSDAGLTAEDYWIGSMNGREISWDWAEQGKITCDVNQPAAMEGYLLYQQVKAFFNGEDFRQHVHPYLSVYNKENIGELRPGLVPATDIDAFMEGAASGAFVTDINDPKFLDIPGY